MTPGADLVESDGLFVFDDWAKFAMCQQEKTVVTERFYGSEAAMGSSHPKPPEVSVVTQPR
jgi:hypothetical protein